MLLVLLDNLWAPDPGPPVVDPFYYWATTEEGTVSLPFAQVVTVSLPFTQEATASLSFAQVVRNDQVFSQHVTKSLSFREVT